MRFAHAPALAAPIVGVALWLAPARPADAQPKPPADFTYPQGTDSPGPVTFSHARHVQAGVDKCTACHTKVFKMKKGTSGPLTMAKMNAGQQCGTCHNGKTAVKGTVVFSTADQQACQNCHKK